MSEEEPQTLVRLLAGRKGALKVGEVAKLLGTSSTYIYGLVRDNRIPYFKIGYTIRLDGKRVAEWLEQREFLPSSMTPQDSLTRRSGHDKRK
jgi:excisionase family DNA binding protein